MLVTNNVLTFTYLDHTKDNGSYQCAARNSHATRYSTAELRVLSEAFAKYLNTFGVFGCRIGAVFL